MSATKDFMGGINPDSAMGIGILLAVVVGLYYVSKAINATVNVAGNAATAIGNASVAAAAQVNDPGSTLHGSIGNWIDNTFGTNNPNISATPAPTPDEKARIDAIANGNSSVPINAAAAPPQDTSDPTAAFGGNAYGLSVP